MKVHQAALLFPAMDQKAVDDLAEDIRKNGLKEPISVLPDGSLIDGRHRAAACALLGIVPESIVVNPEDPVAFVCSKNLHRRHLTPQQRACIAAEALPLYRAQALERKAEGQRRGGHAAHGSFRKEVSESKPNHGKATEKAAAAFDTNEQYVQRIDRMKRRGHEDLVAAVKDGSMTIVAAADESAKRAGSVMKQPDSSGGNDDGDSAPERRRAPMPKDPNSKHYQRRLQAKINHATEQVGLIEGLPELLGSIDVEVVRGIPKLLGHWKASARRAKNALADMLKSLERP